MKKFICFLLVLVMALGVCACSNPGDIPPGVPPQGPPTEAHIENADLLAYSFDRIENADLDFNMSVGSGANNGSSVNALSNDTYSLMSASENEVIINNSDYVQWVDFFSSNETFLQSIRADARRLCDFVLDKVTVVNKIVCESGSNYLLQYEGDDDVLTVYSFYGGVDESTLEKAPEENNGGVGGGIDGEKEPIGGEKEEIGGEIGGAGSSENAYEGKITRLTRIQFYYDKDGDEAVNYFTYGISNYEGRYGISSSDITYIPGKHYVIKNYNCAVNPQTNEISDESVLYTAADRSTGKWQGISFNVNKDAPHFTKEGDYSNRGIFISFLFETDAGIITLGSKLAIYRDGDEIINDFAQPNDQIVLQFEGLRTEAFDLSKNSNGSWNVALTLAALDGWDYVRLDVSDEVFDLGGEIYDGRNHPYLRDENDYVHFENGKKMTGGAQGGSLFVDGLGFIGVVMQDDYPYFVTEDGVVHDSEWSVENIEGKTALQIGGETYLDTLIEIPNLFFVHTTLFEEGGDGILDNPIELMHKMFKHAGLTSKTQDDTDAVFVKAKDYQLNSRLYMDGLFRQWCGYAFTLDNFKEYVFGLMDSTTQKIAIYNGFADKFEKVHISKVPELPTNFSLIPLTNGLTGKATVSEQGIDFTAVNANISKNILLGDQNEYTVCAQFVGKKVFNLANAFEVKQYANANMSLSGLAAELVDLAVGDYQLGLYFAKKTTDGAIRLSETVICEVNDFTAFSKQVDGVGGYYTYNYSCVGGKLNVSVSFTDTQAPAIVLENYSQQESQNVMTFENGKTVGDLVLNVSVEDNCDGSIAIGIDNVLIMTSSDGEAVLSTDALINGEIYRITVKDKAGNESIVQIKVIIE